MGREHLASPTVRWESPSPHLAMEVKSAFNVLQFKADNSKNIAILLESYATPPYTHSGVFRQ